MCLSLCTRRERWLNLYKLLLVLFKLNAGLPACQNKSQSLVLLQGKTVYSRACSTRGWKTLIPKPISMSQRRQRFLSRGRGKAEQRDQGEGVEKFSTCNEQSILIKNLVTYQAMVLCASSWITGVLAPWLKVSKSPGAGMPEGWHLCLLKLVPRILTQTCCSSASCTLVRVRTYRNNATRVAGGLHYLHNNLNLVYCAFPRNLQ